MLEIGPYQVSTVETGSFGLDGGAMFGIVPKPLWEKTNPSDEQNRIEMRLRCLLIQDKASQKNILVDCGIGTHWSEKHQGIYKIDHSRWSLEKGLAKKGLKPEDITDLILTHLHFDHAGGLTRPEGKDTVPVFPNAQIYVQKQNWDLAWNPTEKDRGSYLKHIYSPYKDNAVSGRKLNLIETSSVDPSGKMTFREPRSEETILLPGISVEVSHGHTLGMQIVRISDGSGKPGKSVIYCADLIPTATHVKTAWIMGYDCYPVFILGEKKKLLHRAVDENSILFFEHCPRTEGCTVKRTDKGDFDCNQFISL